MPVVINEFEVVPDTGAPAQANAPAGGDTNQQPATAPDVERLLISRRARELRVRAY